MPIYLLSYICGAVPAPLYILDAHLKTLIMRRNFDNDKVIATDKFVYNTHTPEAVYQSKLHSVGGHIISVKYHFNAFIADNIIITFVVCVVVGRRVSRTSTLKRRIEIYL